MARRGSTAIQEELYSTPDEPAREELDDARLLDLDAEKESPFLRAQKRVSVRRSPLPKKTAVRLLWISVVILLAGAGFLGAAALYGYAERSWRFRLDSSDEIEMSGLNNVTRAQVMEVMGGDIGRNVFFIPLDKRQKQLGQIPWVESASIMRFAPNRIRIEIRERTPVAFARVGSKIMLIDASGVLMDLSNRKKFSFPVIVGMSAADPLSSRAARMKIYDELVRQLDSGGAHYSQDLSEVDLSDAEDLKVLTNDPDGEVLVHLGSSNYLERFKIYVAHLRDWRQRFPKLESVDLRYDRQIIVNPDLPGPFKQPALSATAFRAARAAGVKPSALIRRETTHSVAQRVAPVAPAVTRRPLRPANSKSWHRPEPAATKKVAWQLQHPQHRAIKQASAKAPASRPVVVTKPRTAALRKPSPAIPKGAENR
jgi:cell division protein FtsQ